jgi:hypothetical protein
MSTGIYAKRALSHVFLKRISAFAVETPGADERPLGRMHSR